MPASPELQRRLFLIGPQPPPVHGMSAVNAGLRSKLTDAGLAPIVIDLSGGLERSWLERLARATRILAGLWKLVRTSHGLASTVYLSVSGGWGQLYDLLYVVLARVLGARCFMHHHSSSYLERRSPLMWLIAGMAGPGATHVFLTQGMAMAWRSRYGTRSQAAILSNLALIPHEGPPPHERTALKAIGFLGNVSEQKGILDFLEIARRVPASLTARIAGPIPDASLRQRVLATEIAGMRWVGPVYGADKIAFLDDIDVLISPTRYAHEAEPLTVHEALMRGVPVIAFDRGWIADMLAGNAGLIVKTGADFCSAALTQLEDWLQQPDKLREASRAALARSGERRVLAESQWAALVVQVRAAQ